MKNSIAFLIGAAIGGSIGAIASKLYFQKKYEAEAQKAIEEMEEYYGRTDEYARPETKINEEEEDSSEPNPEKLTKTRDRKKAERVNYQEYYEDDEDEEKEEGLSELDEMDKFHEEHFSHPPVIITEEEAGALPSWIDAKTLYYYIEDDILTDDEEHVIDEPGLVVGTVLEEEDPFGDHKIIFVMNYAHDTCYEIQLVPGQYEDV